jgi:O-antigen/teichoic acid export membrane protein
MAGLNQLLSRFLSDRNDLTRKIFASVALSTMVFSMQVITRILSTVVLTRILAPEVFGVFAVVMMFIFILEQFSDIGVRSLILTKEDDPDDGFLRSCWTVQILRGNLIFLVCALLALGLGVMQQASYFPADSSYADAALPYAVTALGGAAIIAGFASPAKFICEREMKFRQISLETLIVTVFTVVITIGFALWLRNIWALVLGSLASALTVVALSYVMFAGPQMRLNWSWPDFQLIMVRGKWIIGHSALGAVVSVADRLILGFAMSASSFGFYYIARQIADLIGLFLNSVHGQMGLQVFTALQLGGDAAQFQTRYYRYRLLFDGLAMFASGAFLTFAPTLVAIVYDDRYANVAGMIQILAIGLVLIGPGLLREAYSAQRRFREMTMLSLVRAASIWIGLAVAIFGFGSVTAALFVVALHRFPETVVLLVKGRSEGWVSWLSEIRLMPLVAVGAAIGWGLAEMWQLAN